jgi:hypothetical protein
MLRLMRGTLLALSRLGLALLVALLIGSGMAAAQIPAPPPPPTAEDYAAFRAVILAQIDALRRDDFAAAYALAAPSMKALYPNVQAFTQVIRGRYAQLIKPKTVVFGTVSQTSQGPVQRVFITGNDGRAYIATYSLQKQSDTTWLISGHTIARDNGSSAI